MSISTVVFDAYGTLIDVRTAMAEAAATLHGALPETEWLTLAAEWHDKLLEYSWLRSITGDFCDYAQVAADALDWVLAARGLEASGVRAALLASIEAARPYPEAEATLRALKQDGYATALLSNGAAAPLRAAIERAGLAGLIDKLLSADEARVFKPAAAVYDLASTAFGRPRGEILYVSSSGWDVHAATHYGFRTLWVNRSGEPAARLPNPPDMVRPDLSAVPTIARQFLQDLRSTAAQVGDTEYFRNPEGLRLAYRDDGRRDGPVLLCLAGLTRNLADFDFVARDFGGRARILRLDTRGRGQSDWDPDYLNYNLVRESRDAVALLDHLGIEKAAVLGTSRGGLIAMALAAGSKQRLTGVCLNDIGPEIEPEGLAYIASYLGNRPKARTYDEAADGFVTSTAARFPGVPRDRWLLHANRIYCETPEGLDLRYDALLRKSIMEQSATDAIPDVWVLFSALQGLPLALIRGEHSDILSAKTADEMRRRRPDMIYGEVPDRGHVPFLDEPAAQAVIHKFLDVLE